MSDALVQNYLHRLDTAATSLPPSRRSELVGEIADHIAQATALDRTGGEAGVRAVLDRLGDPEDIVAAARDDDPALVSGASVAAAAAPQARGMGREVAAVLLLTVGSFLPVIGWLVGAMLLWTSSRWRTGEKVLGTLIVPGGPLVAAVLGGFYNAGGSCSTTGSSTGGTVQTCSGGSVSLVALTAFVIGLVGPFVVGGFLLYRASRRAQAEAHQAGAA